MVTDLLSTGVYSGLFLITIETTSGQINYTTLPYDVTVGGITYSSDNDLVAIDPPKLSNTADKESFKLTFADASYVFAAASSSLLNAHIRVLGAFYNTLGVEILDSDGNPVSPNKPILCTKDMVIMYEGQVGSFRYVVSEENGVLFEIEGGSPMNALDSLSNFYTSPNSLKQRIPAAEWALAPDTAFDNVSLGGKAKEILWGKI